MNNMSLLLRARANRLVALSARHAAARDSMTLVFRKSA